MQKSPSCSQLPSLAPTCVSVSDSWAGIGERREQDDALDDTRGLYSVGTIGNPGYGEGMCGRFSWARYGDDMSLAQS
jgi:hypothetical protein